MDRARASSRLAGLLAAAFVLATAGCATEFERRFTEAEGLRTEAAAAGSEWLETGELLDRARAENARGNTELALDLVARARFQAETAIRQAEHESQAWTERVIR
jgi:hypothetical protein